MATGVSSAWRVALVVLATSVVAQVAGAPTARLRVSPAGNATCRWKVALVGDDGDDGGRVLCAQELTISFRDIPNVPALPSAGEEARGDTEEALRVTEEFVTLAPTNRPEFHPDPEEKDASRTPPEGYELLPTGNYYKVHKEGRRWHKAKAACEREGAHLVVLESSAEADALRTYLDLQNIATENQPNFYLHAGFSLGLSTVSGNDVSYERWGSGGPTGYFCGRIDENVWLSYGECSEWIWFVCEYEMGTISEFPRPNVMSRDVINASSGGVCSQVKRTILTARGYVPLPGVNGTYIKNYGGGYSWKTGNDTCVKDGAYLPVIESSVMAEALIDYMSTTGIRTFYLGIHTGDPVTVLGGAFGHTYYQRWTSNRSDKMCFFANYQSLYSSFPCDAGNSRNTLCLVKLG